MKRKVFCFAAVLCLCLAALCGCEFDADASLKTITKPYIAAYECKEARFGEENLLDKYEFITITLLDEENLEISLKPKNGKKLTFSGKYEVDPKTREFKGETGILGFTFKESVIIEHGSFTIEKNILFKPLFMKFTVK